MRDDLVRLARRPIPARRSTRSPRPRSWPALLLGWVLLGSRPVEAVAQAPEWRVEPTWSVSAGDGEGEGHQLLWVRDALVLPDGSLVVLSAGTHDIRVFDADGRFVRAVGREGEGPGELESPSGFRRLTTGHVLVYDPGNLRVTELDPGWNVVNTLRVAYDMSAATPAFGRGRPMVDYSVPVATYDTPMLEAVRRGEGAFEDELVIRLYRGEEPGPEIRRPRGVTYTAREGGTNLTWPAPMTDAVLFAWGPEQVVVGSTHSTEFTLFDLAARPHATAHGAGETSQVTADDMAMYDERFRRERSGSMTIRGMSVSSGTRVERFLDEAPRGDSLPFFDALLVADDGAVWAREYRRDFETATWQVLEPGDGVRAKITLPQAWEVLRAHSDYVIVLERDEFDVELVRAYRLVR